MMKVTLRTARSDDFPDLLPMVAHFNKEEGIRNSSRRIRTALAALMRDHSLGRVFLIRLGSELAGYTILTFGYDHEYGGRDGWITDVFIRPEFRRRGIATNALALLEKKAAAARVGALHLMVRRNNRRAQRVYAKCGFKPNPRLAMIKLMRT